MNNFPIKIPVFPLSNFIIFPKTSVPLNIFEPRYLEMVDDCMKSDKYLGMIQPKIKPKNILELHQIGCLGKIGSFEKTNDGRYLIELNGIIRFKIIKEIMTEKKYRICEVDYKDFDEDFAEEHDEDFGENLEEGFGEEFSEDFGEEFGGDFGEDFDKSNDSEY